MRLGDIARMAFQTVRQQPARTALSCGGVIIGSLMLIVSLAAKEGVQHAVQRVFSMGDRMRRITVSENFIPKESDVPPEIIEVTGEMSEEKRARIRKLLIAKWQRERSMKRNAISTEQLATMAGYEHVTEVIPSVREMGKVRIDDKQFDAMCVGASPNNDTVRQRLVAGSSFATPSEHVVVIHEFLAYLCGFEQDDELSNLVGKRIRLEFRQGDKAISRTLALRQGRDLKLSDDEEKTLNRFVDRVPQVVDSLPLKDAEKALLKKAFGSGPSSGYKSPAQTVISEEFTIAGIFRGSNDDEIRFGRWSDLPEDAMVVLPSQTAADLVQRLPGRAANGFSDATVIIDSEDNLKGVMSQIQGLELRTRSLLDFVEAIQAQVVTVTWVLSALAFVALFVSALGITNTMVMSVVERTHEIGVMKAVGARDGHIMLLFLIEGALIGLLGAAVAVLLGWLASYPIDAYAKSILDRRLSPAFAGERVIFFPYWLAFVVPGFSALVTTLASLLPARRAARISPILALRHE